MDIILGSVNDSLKAELKTLIRNNYMDMLKDVIEPECERLITKNVTIDVVSELANRKIQSEIRSAIYELDIEDVISIKIDEILNDKIQKYLANIDNKINSIIKEVMTQKVTDALNDILTK